MPKCREVLALVSTFILTSCGGDGACFVPPCAPPLAVIANVSSSLPGKAVDSVFVRVNGSSSLPAFCGGSSTVTCYIGGSGGTYELDIGAPGFQTIHRTVNVGAEAGQPCGCDRVNTETISVALVPTG